MTTYLGVDFGTSPSLTVVQLWERKEDGTMELVETNKIQAIGPWVFVRVQKKDNKTAGGLFKPDGNFEDRIGHDIGVVLSVGRGKWLEKARKTLPPPVEPGQRIIFRGYLQEANRPGPLDNEHCFLHMDDIIGVVEN